MIEDIENGESGAVVRGKLNAALAEINNLGTAALLDTGSGIGEVIISEATAPVTLQPVVWGAAGGVDQSTFPEFLSNLNAARGVDLLDENTGFTQAQIQASEAVIQDELTALDAAITQTDADTVAALALKQDILAEGAFVDGDKDKLDAAFANQLNLTLLVGAADAVTGFALDAIPDYWKSGVTTITAAHIGNSVTSIGSSAFYSCTALTSVTIGNSVTTIGSSAFYSCTALTPITIPDSVTTIDSYAFHYCTALTSITIPDSVTSIGMSAFGLSGLTSITIPDSVTTIGSYAFQYCTSLTSITITSVPAAAWTGTNGLLSTTLLTDINITADVFAQYDGAWRTAQSVDPSVTLNSI